MMQMKIKLDEERLAEKYDVDKVWAMIDEIFASYNAKKEIQTDGSIIYTSNPKREESAFGDFGLAYIKLKNNAVMGQYCSLWHLLDVDNGTGEVEDEDVLTYLRGTSPLFATGA